MFIRSVCFNQNWKNNDYASKSLKTSVYDLRSSYVISKNSLLMETDAHVAVRLSFSFNWKFSIIIIFALVSSE